MASLAHKLAILNEHLTADVVEVSEFPELAQRYTIYGVPKTVINEAVQFEGAVPEAVFVQRVLEATGAGGANANANANGSGAPS